MKKWGKDAAAAATTAVTATVEVAISIGLAKLEEAEQPVTACRCSEGFSGWAVIKLVDARLTVLGELPEGGKIGGRWSRGLPIGSQLHGLRRRAPVAWSCKGPESAQRQQRRCGG